MKAILAILFLTFGIATAITARAEPAAAAPPTHITASKMDYDDATQINIFTGNARMTRGTLFMKGEKMVLRQNPAGDQHGTMYAPAGGLAYFRQTRDDGSDLWVEGYAERMEHDTKTEVTKLFTRAKLRRWQGKKLLDEVEGSFITYDSKTDVYTVTNTSGSESRPGAGRVKMILQPREDKKKSGASSLQSILPGPDDLKKEK